MGVRSFTELFLRSFPLSGRGFLWHPFLFALRSVFLRSVPPYRLTSLRYTAGVRIWYARAGPLGQALLRMTNRRPKGETYAVERQTRKRKHRRPTNLNSGPRRGRRGSR